MSAHHDENGSRLDGPPERLLRVPRMWHALIWLGIFAILYELFYTELVIFLVFSVAVLLAAVIHPTVTWLHERAHIPRGVAVLIVIVAIIAFVVGILYWIVPPIIRQVEGLVGSLPQLIASIRRTLAGFASVFPGGAAGAASSIERWVMGLLGSLKSYVFAFGEAVVAFIAVVLVTIYTLASPLPLARGLLLLWPEDQRERVGQIVNSAIGKVGKWMVAQLIAMATVGVLIGVTTWLLGLPFPTLWGVVAGIFEIVPTLGPILGGVGPVAEALAIEPIRALWVVLAFIAIQQFENHVIIPLIIGRSLSMHPASVLFVVFIMGALFGLLGIFIAVPLMAVLQAIYEVISEPPPAQQRETEAQARTALDMPPDRGEGRGRAS